MGTTLLGTTGCADQLSILHPAGPAAQTIANAWWIMLAAGCAIFVLVMVILALALRQPAVAAGQGENEHGIRIWMWAFGLGFPLLTLSALTGYGLVIGERLLPRDASNLVTVSAEARQWVWTFGYAADPDRTTENVLHIPAGRPVNVEITSTDVIHSFWVPRLAGKLDAIPGHVNVLRIEAAKPGTYAGVSAEYSGTGYREHVFTVEAHDPVAWATFLREGPP